MKLSGRLLSCAEMVQQGNTAADVGTDHGHLAIYLLEHHICPHVYASDIRQKPLETARRNARKAAVEPQMTFCLSNGLKQLPMERIQTVICAGMGGETIVEILKDAEELRDPARQLILQPQTRARMLRNYLAEQGFSVLREKLSQDGHFIYTAMEARYGGGGKLSPGEQMMPKYLLESGDPLVRPYFSMVRHSVRSALAGLEKAKCPDPDHRTYFETAWKELMEMEEYYGLGE